jgi:hypothetical protein
MISCAECVSRIRAQPAPVLLIDTSALLDLIRDPTRDRFSDAHVLAAIQLLECAEKSQTTLWLILAQQVLNEINDNRPTVLLEAERSLISLESTVKRVQSILSAHGINTTDIASELSAAKFSGIADALVTRYLEAGVHIKQPTEISGAILTRIARNAAPSQKGTQAKDCIVIETYLHFVGLLRASDIGVPVVFFTTNKNDYSDLTKNSLPHPDLVPEFSRLDIRCAINFQMTEHLLR